MTTKFWHGFADMHVIADREVVIASGDGAVITDTNGNDYIDATAALWYCNAGYGRREIAEAVADQLVKLHGYSSFGAYTTDATLRVSERLAALAPFPNAVVYLASGGSDAVDTAGEEAGWAAFPLGGIHDALSVWSKARARDRTTAECQLLVARSRRQFRR